MQERQRSCSEFEAFPSGEALTTHPRCCTCLTYTQYAFASAPSGWIVSASLNARIGCYTTLDEQSVLQGYQAGAIDYLTKPVNSSILRSKLSVLVEMFQQRKALTRLNEHINDMYVKRTLKLEDALNRLEIVQERLIEQGRFALLS